MSNPSKRILLSCQDNVYSLDDSLILFINSQDYRYRTINKYMNCNDVNKWSTDIVAIIPSFVESKNGLFPGHSYVVKEGIIATISVDHLFTSLQFMYLLIVLYL